MVPSPKDKYAARLSELEALHHGLEAGKRPGDGAVEVGLVLEAAGDVLRRKLALGVKAAEVTASLGTVPELALRSWAEGVQVEELTQRLRRAASQAVEAALPDSEEDGESLAQWAVQDLQARDRLESALVALETMAAGGRHDAKNVAVRLRAGVANVDRACRSSVACLTPLNGTRRAEAALLDAEFRSSAWWYTERIGIDEDQLVRVLGGDTTGSLPDELKSVNKEVNRKRMRPVSFDELLRFDLGLTSSVENAMLRTRAQRDSELKLSLAAMESAEEVINDVMKNPEVAPSHAVVPVPSVERASSPEIVEERLEFRVLLFRTKKNVQVVVQPHRLDRFAAAAVFRSDEPDRAFSSTPGDMGLHFDLGHPDELNGIFARVVVRLTHGQTHAFEVRL